MARVKMRSFAITDLARVSAMIAFLVVSLSRCCLTMVQRVKYSTLGPPCCHLDRGASSPG